MLNRKAIQTALANYKESLKQSKQILKDKEVQSLFEKEENEKAVSLYTERYPMGAHKVVSSNRIKLIELMIKDIPAWKGITAEDVLCAHTSVFDDMIKLAEKV